MRIGIIDADLVGRKNHRFPNLASMKISAYHKSIGDQVTLLRDYDSIDKYDHVYISKAFTDTKVPPQVLLDDNVTFGGTGFYYDKAEPLPYEIEHIMPDYHLYDDFVSEQLMVGVKPSALKFYTDYSIGYLTRGCFRHCEFCVNKNSNRSEAHSPLEEFYDPTRKKICMLDDNFFGCADWKRLLQALKKTGKPFQFRQGMDERILTDEKCEELFSAKYDGYHIFAFDNIADRDLIECKLEMIRRHTDKQMTFYVLVGFDRSEKYDDEFYKQDIIDMFERCKIIGSYGCTPYIMRHEMYKTSPYQWVYTTVTRWCNQPAFFKNKTFRQFCQLTECDINMLNLFGEALNMPEYIDTKLFKKG